MELMSPATNPYPNLCNAQYLKVLVTMHLKLKALYIFYVTKSGYLY